MPVGTPVMPVGTPVVPPGGRSGTLLCGPRWCDPMVTGPAEPGVRDPGAAPAVGAGGVITTVEPFAAPVASPDAEPVAGATLRTAAPPPGKRQVTSRSEQYSGMVVRSVDASAAYAVNDPPAIAAAIAKPVARRIFMMAPTVAFAHAAPSCRPVRGALTNPPHRYDAGARHSFVATAASAPVFPDAARLGPCALPQDDTGYFLPSSSGGCTRRNMASSKAS